MFVPNKTNSQLQKQDAVDYIEYLKSIDSPTISNAIESFDHRPRHEGFAPCDIRCIHPELGKMCGWAVTPQFKTKPQPPPATPNMFGPLFQAQKNSQKPAVIAFQEIGAYPRLS